MKIDSILAFLLSVLIIFGSLITPLGTIWALKLVDLFNLIEERYENG